MKHNRKALTIELLTSLIYLSVNALSAETLIQLKDNGDYTYEGEASIDNIDYDITIKAPDYRSINGRTPGLDGTSNKMWELTPKAKQPYHFQVYPNLNSLRYDINGKTWRVEITDAKNLALRQDRMTDWWRSLSSR